MWVQSDSTGSGSATTYMRSAKAKIAKQMENEICMVVVLFSPATTSESPARAVDLQLRVAFYEISYPSLKGQPVAVKHSVKVSWCIDQ